MGSILAYYIVTGLVFLTIVIPIVIFMRRQVKNYKRLGEAEEGFYSGESEEELQLRLQKELYAKMIEKKAELELNKKMNNKQP